MMVLSEFWSRWKRLVDTLAVSWLSDEGVAFLDRRDIPWSLKKTEARSMKELSDLLALKAVDGWPAYMAAVQLRMLKGVESQPAGVNNVFYAAALKQMADDELKLLEQTMSWRTVCTSVAAEKCDGTVLLADDLYGDLVLLAEALARSGGRCKFLVAENRPFLQGSRIASWVLTSSGFDTTVITDNAVGYVAWKRMVDTVLVEAAAATESGEFVVPAGSYQTAVVCSENDVKVVVLMYPFRLKNLTPVETESRHVLVYRGKYITSPDLKTYHTDYELVEPSYVSEVITPFGVYSSAEKAVEDVANG
ncbi:MAG: hypothetical protein QXI02_02055 [Candidatus Caldarchaeum sp.]